MNLSVVCVGEEALKSIKITRNLDEALRHLRHEWYPMCLDRCSAYKSGLNKRKKHASRHHELDIPESCLRGDPDRSGARQKSRSTRSPAAYRSQS
jgi:hypothetical protein